MVGGRTCNLFNHLQINISPVYKRFNKTYQGLTIDVVWCYGGLGSETRHAPTLSMEEEPEVESDSETPYEPDGDYTATMITSHPHIPSPHN